MTLRTGLILLAAAAGLALAWLAHDILLLAFLGLVIAVVLSFPVGWLSRRMPRSVAVLLVLLVAAGVVVVAALLVAPTMSDQFEDLRTSLPRSLANLRQWLSRRTGGQAAKGAAKVAEKASEVAVPAVLGVISALTAAILVIVLGAFLVAAPDVYRRGLRRMVPGRLEPVFDEAYDRVGRALRKWVGGIVVSMAIMGTLAAVGLKIAGINDWLLLGALTFFGTFVPYVGAIASAIPGLLVALTQDSTHFLYAGAVYLGVHVVEGYLIQPLVMRKAVEIKPALLLVGQGALTAMFGLAGTVVATPLIVCGQTLMDYLWVERRLGKAPAGEDAGSEGSR
ncbi:MAG TPA: AI-2E family transporter [Myxococcales bacterium]|nr:AI-2E family transporter [Myxococcales bacterium]